MAEEAVAAVAVAGEAVAVAERRLVEAVAEQPVLEAQESTAWEFPGTRLRHLWMPRHTRR